MKNSSIYKWKFFLVGLVFFTYLGLQISCNPENSFDRKVEVNLQIPIPGNGSLKNASATAGVKSVILTVTSGDEVLVTEELTISGNTASGTISILPGKNRKFTADAMDENNIIQWHGSTTIDIVDNFTVGIELTPIAPSATNLQALQQEKSINLSWTQNADLDFSRYDLYRSQLANELGAVIYSSTVITETQFKDSLISGGNTYFYTLVVADSEGFNSKSNVVQVDVSKSPPSVSILQVISSSRNMVELSWTQNTDLDFARYDLYRSSLANELGTIIHSTTIITETGFIDNKVSDGNTYFYTLVVTDSEELNSKSNVVQVDLSNSPPSASILQVISISNSMVELSWTQNTDLDFARYDLYRSQLANELGTIIQSTTIITEIGFNDNKVSEGNTYFYTLVVSDSEGFNSKSNVVRVVVSNSHPSASILKVISISNSMVELSWTQNTDKDFARYDLYRSQLANELGTIIHSTNIITEIGFKDNSVSEGKSYFYTLVVTDSEGFNTNSNVVRADIPNTIPSENILQIISSSSNMVELSWTQNTDKDFARYDLYRSQSERVLGAIIHSTKVNTETGYKDTSISEGKSYFYTMVVLNTEGSNNKSNEVRADIPFIPPTASILQLISVGGSKVGLSWTKNTDKDFARYELYRSQEGNTLGKMIHSTTVINNTEYEDNTVSENSSYFYTLVVFDTDESNSESNVVRADIPNYPPTASILQVNSTSYNMVKLSWTRNTDLDFARYELYRSQEGNVLGTMIHTTNIKNNTEFEDNTVSPNTTYLYTLVVFDTKELSAKSNVARADVPQAPPVASILQVNSVSTSIVELSWTKNTDQDFARYELHRSESENELGSVIFSTTDVAKLDYGDIQLTEGSIYFYTLVVTDTKGLNTKSNVVQAEIPNYPPIASTLSGNYEFVEDSVSSYVNFELTWTQNEDNDFYEYNLFRSTEQGNRGENIFSTNDITVLNFNDNNLDYFDADNYNYINYYYTMVVTDKGGLSAESTWTWTVE